MTRRLALLFSMIGFILPVNAQNMIPLTRAALDSLMNPILLEGREKILSVDKEKQSVGTLLESDSSVTIDFTFTCHKEVVLTRIKTFCGCTTAACDKFLFKAGEKGTITLVYHPKNHPGTINESAYVYTTDSEDCPVARLTVLGEVKETDKWRHLPHRIGDIRLKRKTMSFKRPDNGIVSVERIICANTGKYPLTLSGTALPEYAHFHVEPSTLAPGQEGDMVVTIDWNKFPVSEKNFSFYIQGTKATDKERVMNVIIEKK